LLAFAIGGFRPGLVLAALVIVTVACGDGGEPPSPSPESTASPARSPLPDPTLKPSPEAPAVRPTTSLDLATDQPLLTLGGANAEDFRIEASSLAAGDFNGDGVDDLLIGAPSGDGPDESREEGGEAYLVFGSRGLGGGIDLVPEQVGLIVYGALPGDELGFAVAGGDLNGDGIDDVVVSAPASNGLPNIRTDLGEVYIIFGSPSLGGVVDTANSEQDVTVIAAEGFARLGTSLAIGDVNGDGTDDLVAGAPFAGREEGTPPGGPRTTLGEVYVVFGSPSLPPGISVARSEQDFTMSGSRELDTFGGRVVTADVNGDGIADIIASARGDDGPDDSRADVGAGYVFFGGDGLSGKRGVEEASVAIFAADEEDFLGDAVASGDIDGDGIADIVLASRFGDGPANRRNLAGEVYVILGSPSLPDVIDLASDEPGAVVYGVDGADRMAASLATADLDGDGADELIMGVPFGGGLEDARERSGEVYVLAGRRLLGSVDLRYDVAGVAFIFGAAAEDRLGTAVLAADPNGDGTTEIVVLAHLAAGQEERAGAVYAVPVPASSD